MPSRYGTEPVQCSIGGVLLRHCTGTVLVWCEEGEFLRRPAAYGASAQLVVGSLEVVAAVAAVRSA